MTTRTKGTTRGLENEKAQCLGGQRIMGAGQFQGLKYG